jgi:importin subunit beta-1
LTLDAEFKNNIKSLVS